MSGWPYFSSPNPVRITINPVEGLKLAANDEHRTRSLVRITINPVEGLKPYSPRAKLLHPARQNND